MRVLLTLALAGLAAAQTAFYTGDTQQYIQVGSLTTNQMKAGITFQARAYNDIHVGLFPSNPIDQGGALYEIVIGGWGNTQSVIRRSNGGGNEVTVSTPNICDGVNLKTFTVTYDGGVIDVQENGVSFMTWTDSSPMLISYLGFMTGWGSDGNWVYVPQLQTEEILFEMRVDTLMGETFGNYGGFGNYANTNHYTMTQFNGCGYYGQQMKLTYSGGNSIYFKAMEDCFSVDGEGSLRIKTDMGGNSQNFYIAQGTTNAPGWRGLCFHNNQWGQGQYNCDGDAGQSCGFGLWGEYAANEITGCANNLYGYWNDMNQPNCGVADVCSVQAAEMLTLLKINDSTAMMETVAFSMTIDTLMTFDWKTQGGFGMADTTSGMTMTSFASTCGYLGMAMSLRMSAGNSIEFVAAEDCFTKDQYGSLRIKTNMGGNNNYLYIAQSDANAPGWRGACFHNNQWGQGDFNCDGDAGQSCGMGLWGEYAANEITGCPQNRNGYWNDMGPNDCVNADVCIGSGSETISLVMKTVAPPPTVAPTPAPTPMPVKPPTAAPSPSPTPAPVTPSPTPAPPTVSPSPSPTPMPVAPAPLSCKDISKLNLTAQEIYDECNKTTYCKSKFKKAKGTKPAKAKCKKLKCKKCKKDMACCTDNPEGCIYNPAGGRNVCTDA